MRGINRRFAGTPTFVFALNGVFITVLYPDKTLLGMNLRLAIHEGHILRRPIKIQKL